MMYDSYQAMADVGDSARLLAANAERILNIWTTGPFASPMRRMAAYYEAVALAGFTHERPSFNLPFVDVRGEIVAVEDEVVASTAFCDLRRFRKASGADEPKVLLVAPMSGHFATLLRGTLKTMLRDHEVYVTDWINPRIIPLQAGPFALDDYTQHLIDFIRRIGPEFACRRRLPAGGFGVGGDRHPGPARRQRSTGEPDADGGADRHAHRADQGQRPRQ